MKLTNYIRDAFIRAVMDDVPKIDYDELLRNAATKKAVELLPEKVRAVYDEFRDHRYLATYSVSTVCGVGYVHVPGEESEERLDIIAAAIAPLVAQHMAQQEQRNELEKKIRACAYSVTTRKALAELLPEFEKYLPPDNATAIRTLPVVANVVSDFVKAGWPKEKAA